MKLTTIAIALCCAALPAIASAQGAASPISAEAKAAALAALAPAAPPAPPPAAASDPLTEGLLSKLMDAASRRDLESYKGERLNTKAPKGTKPKWYATIDLPGGDGGICYTKDDGVFWIVMMYVEEPAAAAAARAAKLSATMKKLTEAKRGSISPGRPDLYILGGGELYVDLDAGEKAGYEYVSIVAQHRNK